MISEKLLPIQRLRYSAKEFAKKNKNIFDIVIYGSIIRGKTDLKDIDIAILFSEITNASIKLHTAQVFKSKIKSLFSQEADVRGVDLKDMMDHSFLARRGIMAEGFSLIKNKPLRFMFGFENYYIFAYSLDSLSNSQKTTFQYIMKGRRKEKGLLSSREGKQLGRGVIMIPLKYVEEFNDLFTKLKIEYKIYHALFY